VVLTDTVPANTTFDVVGSSSGWSCVDANDAPYTCTIDYGDGLGAELAVTSGYTCAGSNICAEAGVYTDAVTVTDKDGDSGSAECQFIIICDNQLEARDDSEPTATIGDSIVIHKGKN